MRHYNYKMFGPDPDFDEENATDQEKAQEWWGNPDVDPETGTDYDDERGQYNPDDGTYEYDD